MKIVDLMDEKQCLLEMDKFTQDNKSTPKNTLQLYKLIQSINSACDKNINEIKKLQAKHDILDKVEPLQLLNDNQAETVFSSSESKKRFKKKVISSLMNVCYQECQHDDYNLLFFAAATFNISKLKEIIKLYRREDINQTRFSDSVIIFTLKYGDVSDENFLECMKLLINAGVDINKSDTSGKFAIDYVAILFNKNTNPKEQEDLRKVAKLIIDRRICETEDSNTKKFIESELQIDLTRYAYAKQEIESRLFYWISKYKKDEFLSFKKIHHYVNCDNGENTLLQFAVNKSQNMLPIVEHLLKNGADPNKVTEINPFTPLEIAARNNYESIFKVILNWKETRINQEQFSNFVKWRGYYIKRELFGTFLESDKLDPTFVYERTGNTPLHYAIRLCHKNAIQKLLRRPDVSLTVRNNCEKCPLDILNATDLNVFLDSCIIFDTRRTIDFSSTEYKMQFRFRRLTDGILPEVDVVCLLGKYRHLENLLAHPLIHSYIMLKWFKVRPYFWTTIFVQAFLFSLLSVFFYRFPFSSPPEHAVCFFFCMVNIVLKCWVFLTPKEVLQNFFSLSHKPTTFHEFCEILLMISSLASFWITEFRAFVFIEMAIVFLLTAGYHPKLAHWSIMLQKVFRTFTMLLVFFSLLMIAFAAGFHIMFQDHRFFTALYRSVFMSYFMTIGEINVSEVDFERTPFGGYLLFFVFAMSMSVVIINIWTGVAIRDIDKFEKQSEVNALKNVVAFMSFIEKHVYNIHCFKKILPNPLLFPKPDKTYIVDFYPNKDDQFELKYICPKQRQSVKKNTERRFPEKLDVHCFEKIKIHYYKQQTNTSEQKILTKLDRVLQSVEAINQIKNKVLIKQNTIV